jgi:hypothetical protein
VPKCGQRGENGKARIAGKNKAQISRSGLRKFAGGVGLLVFTHGRFGRDWFEVTEIEFGAGRASGVVTAGRGAVAGAKSPEAANGERLSGCGLDEANELTRGEIVGGNSGATIRGSGAGELAYEQVVAKDPEVERSEGYAPGRIEPVSVFEAFKELTIGGEDVDVPQTGAIGFLRVAFLLQNEGDDDVVTDGLHVEGHEAQSQDTYDRASLSLVLTLLVGIGRILAQNELLYQAVGEPPAGVDERVGENQSRPTIAWRIVEVCKSARDQIAANA